jgi:ferredoxin
VSYKITIEIKEKKMTTYELKQASRYISEALSKMGIDHVIDCHMDKLKLYRVARAFLNLRH